MRSERWCWRLTSGTSTPSSLAAAIRKRGGKMIGVNMDKFRQMADESREYLFMKAGYTLDIFSKG